METIINKTLQMCLREMVLYSKKARLSMIEWFRHSEEEVEAPKAGMLRGGPVKEAGCKVRGPLK